MQQVAQRGDRRLQRDGGIPGRRHVKTLGEHAGEGAAEQLDASKRRRADRLAVEVAVERDEARAQRPPVLRPVLDGELQRDLHRRRAVVAEEDALQTGPMIRRAGLMTRRAGAARRDAAQRLGQLRCGRVRHAGERAVAVLARLPFERRDQTRVVVTERRHPPRRVGVEIAASVGVEEPRALRAHHHDRVDARRVLVHRRVRVPDPPLVEGDDVVAVDAGHRRD